MKIEQLLSDTLAEHEHLAPNTDQILADVQRRIDRPRAAGWPVALGAAAVLVVGTGAGVVALRGHHQSTTAAVRSATSTAPVTSISSAKQRPVRPAARIAPLTMPFDLGWLPAGPAGYLAHRINIGSAGGASVASFDGEYMLQVTTAAGKVDIDVQQMPGDLSDVSFKSGPGSNTAVNGHPAIESQNSDGPGGYEIYFQDSTGGTTYVNVATAPGQHVAVTQLVSDGCAIASGVRYPGSTKVNPSFGVGYVPAGMKVVAFDVENDNGQYDSSPADLATTYDIGDATNQSPAVVVTSGPASAPTGTPGRLVQGHPTRYSTDRGYTEFYVLNAVHGDPIMIGSSLPLAQIYRIADGLVLPH